jgi:hypothetical protein
MGGLAFADEDPPLSTPRMAPAVYTHLRDHLLNILGTFYAQAKCPIEAPGKSDHGDIDILVAEPLHNFDAAQLARVIGAVKHKKTAGSPTTHFATPWPTLLELDGNDTGVRDHRNGRSNLDHQNYAQLDLHVCTPESFTWEVFHQCHGDFWNIIGSTVRPLGFTPSNSGFYVRIQELEAKNKTAARVLLTTSPSHTLQFLGLDESRYWQKFETVDELFAYAATCRFFNPKRYDPARSNGDLKANDRARARKRPAFRRWVKEYLPGHVKDAPADETSARLSREEAVEDAKGCFGVIKEYEERRRTGIREIRRDKMWTQIRKELDIDADSVGAVMRGVKREVICGEGQSETKIQRAYAEDDFDVVVQWAREDWKEIEQRQRRLEREKSTKNLLAKLERLRAEGKADAVTRPGKPTEGAAGDQDG